MTTTANDLIQTALKKLGVLAPGESVSVNDANDGLSELNDILNSMSADGINLYYRVHESFSLVAGDGDYSIGASANFDTVRPNEIEQAFIRDSSNTDWNLKVRPISEYWALGYKNSSARPTRIYYDPTYPNGTIYFNTLPSAVETLHLVSQKILTNFAALTTELSLPDEYKPVLINLLAIAMAPYFGKSVSAELAAAARETYGNLKARNLANSMKPARVSMPGRGQGTYNIDADQ